MTEPAPAGVGGLAIGGLIPAGTSPPIVLTNEFRIPITVRNRVLLEAINAVGRCTGPVTVVTVIVKDTRR